MLERLHSRQSREAVLGVRLRWAENGREDGHVGTDRGDRAQWRSAGVSGSRRRLSGRGRATSLLLLGCAVGVLATLVFRLAPQEIRQTSSLVPSPVATGPPASAALPASLFAHLPTGLADFEQAVQAVASLPDLRALGDRALVDWIPVPANRPHLQGPLRVDYALDVALTERVFKVLRKARARRAHAIVLDPNSGRVLAYASTDVAQFPPNRAYPAASLVKVVTAAAALDRAPEVAREPCRYLGNPYKLTRSRLHPPKTGRESSLERSLAMSNNQCFAQLAVNAIGDEALMDTLDRFGWLDSPAPGHDAGIVELGEGEYDLGRLGCGLAGCRITPLHAAQLAATLVRGELITPWWIDRVLDARGHDLPLPPVPAPESVMSEDLAQELRRMLVRTTTGGTARSAFRNARGRPLLDGVKVAGKTGNLSGRDPKGRYEWFMGVAPADRPSVAVAVVQIHDDLWWQNSSQIAANVLHEVFCERSRCRAELAARYTGTLGDAVTPVFLNAEARVAGKPTERATAVAAPSF